jgi:CIC family chloride channel protein
MRSSPAHTLSANPLQSHEAVDSHQHEDKVLLLLTLIIGAVVGLVVVAFILLTENLGSRLYPRGSAAWRRVLIPLAGALGTGFLLHRYFPNARGSGIPQTKTALFLRDGYISFRTVLGKFGLCSVSLASGIALGREGPSVQVGAGIASTLGRKLGLSHASIKALVPAGASAALAAAFNTPISAVLFSLEEVMGDMHAPVLGSIVLSSATSWMVLHLILGDDPLFHVPAYQLVHPVEFIWYAALGLLGGLVSVAFVKLLLWQRKYFLRAPEQTQWFLPGVGGLAVGLLGLFSSDVLGVGYAVVGKALNGQLVITTMALLVILKVVATATCYASGNAGGIFGPSLFMGAMMGGAVGGVAHLLMPDYTASAGAYALVGMGAAFAGIVRVPLTSVIMVFEITRDYSIIVPLMIANLISYFISSRLQEEPIYEALQHQDGIRLPSGAGAREALLMIGHGNRPAAQVLPASETVAQGADSIDRTVGAYPVVDEHGFRGMVTLEQLDEAIREGLGGETLESLVPAAPAIDDLIEGSFPHVYPDDPLDAAMRWLADGKIKVLPVLSRMNPRELRGTISLSDVLAAYALARPSSGKGAEEAIPARLPLRLLAGVLAALVGVAILTASLNYFYRVERDKRAELHYRTANELMQKERLQEAIEQYRDALSISHRIDHRLALGLALVKTGRLDEASIYLSDVLRQQPGSGPANLGIAAIDGQERRIDDAVMHYHRAIYGSWPSDPAASRIRARMQLVDFLKKSGRAAQARAELIALVADAPVDPSQQKQIGRLLLDFDMPREAADLYRGLLKRGPPDANEYDNLGEAEFALKDYKSAARAFHSALEIDPGDPIAGPKAQTCDQILSLDPMQRELESRERFRRTQELLGAVLSHMAACFGSEASMPASLQDDIKAAQLSVANRRPSRSFSDAADAQISLAERLWTKVPNSCTKNGSDSLALIMSRLISR